MPVRLLGRLTLVLVLDALALLALSWLLSDLRSRHSLASEQIIQAADLGIGESMPSWDML